MSKLRNCGDCGARPGELHKRGCDVEPCPGCGGQYAWCDRRHRHKYPRIPWTGEFPGVAECREFGWYVLPDDDREVIGLLVPEVTPGARPALNHLGLLARWDTASGRFVRDPATERRYPKVFAGLKSKEGDRP
jgi:hypothetical protein